MSILLDSHVVLWVLGGEPFGAHLGSASRAMIADAEQVFVSAVTPWELGIKRALGKISYPDGLTDMCRASGFEMLPVTSVHATIAPQLPAHHRDPFDRMLIAQAIFDGYSLMSADEVFDNYPVTRVDPRR